MANKFVSIAVLDGGLLALKNGATKMLLLKSYAVNDSYATVMAASVASVDMVPGDFAITGAAGASRVVTVAAKSLVPATASSGASPDLHIAFTDGVSEVFLVTDETSNQEIINGNDVNFPSITYTSSQPA